MKPAMNQRMQATQPSISVLVLTYNEEANIQACLSSLVDWVTSIYIVDSGSSDLTLELARDFTDHIVVHEFVNQAQQFNWALDHLPLETEWILRLDADEIVLPELRDEIVRVLPGLPSTIAGLYLKRRVYFKGRWIKHGGYYPTWLLRLFRRGKARSEQLEMDEHIVLLEGESRRLRHDFVDFNRKDLAFWTIKHERFAAREAMVLMRQSEGNKIGEVEGAIWGNQPARRRWLKGTIYARSPLFLRAFVYFLYRYFLRLGFLDGPEGLVFHVLQGFWYRFYVDAKIWEQKRMQALQTKHD